jgi:hypothetical protein
MAPEPPAPPVIPPVTEGGPQVYVVPAGTTPLVTFAGVSAKDPPLQINEVILVIAGVGFTITVLVMDDPGHSVAPGPFGVIVYVTVTAELLSCCSCLVKVSVPSPSLSVTDPPAGSFPVAHVYPPAGLDETLYSKIVLLTVELSVIIALPSLHMVCVLGLVALISGIGAITIV